MLGSRIWQRSVWGFRRRFFWTCISLSPSPSEQSAPFRKLFSGSTSGSAPASFRRAGALDTINFNDLYMKTRGFSTEAAADLPAGEIVDVPLAQTGEGIAECELLKWFVQEGDQVEEFQPLCEVQSDKATIEITSRYKGQVAHLLFVPGNIVKGQQRFIL